MRHDGKRHRGHGEKRGQEVGGHRREVVQVEADVPPLPLFPSYAERVTRHAWGVARRCLWCVCAPVQRPGGQRARSQAGGKAATAPSRAHADQQALMKASAPSLQLPERPAPACPAACRHRPSTADQENSRLMPQIEPPHVPAITALFWLFRVAGGCMAGSGWRSAPPPRGVRMPANVRSLPTRGGMLQYTKCGGAGMNLSMACHRPCSSES